MATRTAISISSLILAIGAVACEPPPRERRLPVPDLRGGGPELELDADAPLDPRVVPLDRARLVGTTRPCDLSFVGEPAASTGAHPLPEGFARRLMVRCYAATGEGDVDLLIPEPLAERLGELAPKVRVEVKIRSANGGLSGAPSAALVDVVGPAPLEPPPPAELATMAARDRFGDRELLRQGESGRCAIAWVGRFELIPEDELARRPPGTRHRVRVACRHTLGEDEVELVFSDRRATAALGLRRGRIVELRVLSREGPMGALPITAFALRSSNG